MFEQLCATIVFDKGTRYESAHRLQNHSFTISIRISSYEPSAQHLVVQRRVREENRRRYFSEIIVKQRNRIFYTGFEYFRYCVPRVEMIRRFSFFRFFFQSGRDHHHWAEMLFFSVSV